MQMSVAHACERPTGIVQNNESHPLRLGVAIFARFVVSCVLLVSQNRFLATA